MDAMNPMNTLDKQQQMAMAMQKMQAQMMGTKNSPAVAPTQAPVKDSGMTGGLFGGSKCN